jgi:hypothetical protein
MAAGWPSAGAVPALGSPARVLAAVSSLTTAGA